MNKTAIKNFAVWAREKLISDIIYRAGMLGITENGIANELPQSTSDLLFFDIGTKNYVEVFKTEIPQRNALVKAINKKEKDTKNYKEAFNYVVEEVAYTWFNRLIAIRFMEVNDYLPSGIRVLSSENKAKNEPDFVTNPFDTDLEFTSYEQDRIIQLKDENKLDELFRMLFIKQCNKLHDILPELFEKTDDYSELLLTISFTDTDGIVYHLVHDIDEDDFNVEKEGQVEIIGWMYQYYNVEPKAEVFARPKSKKISKDDIPAATQLFTPDWIVHYMVENSLGRLWLERNMAQNGHDIGYWEDNNRLKSTWKYYIDEAEQDSEVQTQLYEIRKEYRNINPEEIKFMDPCMGSGHILVYAFDVLMQIYESYGYTQRDASISIVKNNLFGMDIDKRAYQLAYFAVMMKARSYNRRILSLEIKPNLCYIQSSNVILGSSLEIMGDNKAITQQLLTEFKYASEYGSVLNVTLSEEELQNINNQIDCLEMHKFDGDLIHQSNCNEVIATVKPILEQAIMLVQKYDVAVTNPPYMPVSNADAKLNKYVKKYYPDSKTDLFAVFIERCKQMLKINGYQAMITMHSWMFLSSYKNLREKMLLDDTINMAHLGARSFEEIGGEVVQTTAFVRRNSNVKHYKGTYCRLIDPNTQQGKEDMFLDGKNRYIADQSNFSKIPGSPIAYWWSDTIYNCFTEGRFLPGKPMKGIQTGNGEKYLRFWHEISIRKMGLNLHSHQEMINSKLKWFPLTSGGLSRRWYGNYDMVVNLENDGATIRATGLKNFRLKDPQYYFLEGLTWTEVTTKPFTCRYLPSNILFGNGGPVTFLLRDNLLYTIGLLNSYVVKELFTVLAPTMNYGPDQVRNIPFKLSDKEHCEELVEYNIIASRDDWDSFETSWDFKRHPLLNFGVSVFRGLGEPSNNNSIDIAVKKTQSSFKVYEKDSPKNYRIEQAYDMWKESVEERFIQLKSNEEELNRIFIDIYGLQDELNPEVADKDITVHRIYDTKDDVPDSMKGSNYIRTKHDEIVSLISYAVGCIFGRYSLDREGLVFAGGNFDEVYWKYKGQAALGENGKPIDGGYAGISLAEYRYPKFHDTDNWQTATSLSFAPDADNCIPITDEEYFEDDIVGLFCAWLKKAYGEDTLEENLDFIANALGNKGKTSREIIRNYFLTDFIKDHIKTYQKRPIYWLFNSGKQNGFKALVYMHRWNADTIGNVRVEYLHRIQRVYEKEIIRMQEIIDNGSNNKEISNATKRKEKLLKQIKETKDYDAKVAHLALFRIDIDLDDGVKVNYEKVQTADGKKMQILAKI